MEVVNSDTGSGAVASHELNYDHSKIGGYVDEVTATNDEQFPISYLKYSKGGVDYDITEIPKPDGLIQGGAVSWVKLLKFDVSAAAYYLEGILYTTDSAQVTLGAADVDNPRIDIIIVDTTGAVSVVAGVPNANPQKPTVDPVTQIELTNILVPTGATEPGIVVTEELIYDENVEWTLSYTGTTADGSDATAPYHGSVAVATGGLTNNDTIVFAADEPIDVAVFESLIFNIRLNAVMTNQHRLYVRWMTGVNYTTNEVLVNLNKSVTTGYQNINIPLSSFIWDSGLIDGLQFRWSKSGGNVIHAGIYLDYIKLQKGISVTPVSSGIELTGDVTGSGVTGSPVPTTLATVNSNVGQFGDATNVPKITVDGKGRVTAIENVAVTIPPAITPTSDLTPVDTDEVVSLRGTSWLKTTWTVLKAFLKTYFDNVYSAINHAHTFLSLTDTPASYAGSGSKIVAVNSGASALEFIDAPAGTMSIVDHSTGAFTLALTDAGNYLTCNYASGFTVTVPKNSVVAFPVGTVICLEQVGNGAITMAPVDVDVTLVAYDGLTSYGQYAVLTLVKKGY